MRLSSLGFMQPEHVSENLARVRSFANVAVNAPGSAAFSALQGCPSIVPDRNERHCLVTAENLALLKRSISGLMGGEFPASFRCIEPIRFERMQRDASTAEALIAQLYSEDFAAYRKLISHVVYAYRDEYSGGSVSNHIGWIWLSPEPAWSIDDYADNLIHEYTHNVLFLEEMTRTLFAFNAEIMALPQNQVVSAIRKIPRFFDQSYHAAAVAIVLAEHALNCGRTGTATLLVEGLLPSLDLLKERRELMTENGWRLLAEMIRRGLEIYGQAIEHRHAA